jgi:hypothetical protein
MKKFTRAVAIAALLAFAAWGSGCNGTNLPNAQNEASGLWQANLTGGSGSSSGLSFNVEFQVTAPSGPLSITNFQFLNSISGGCFPVTGVTPNGTLDVTYNSAFQITGTFSFTVVNSGNTLTLTSTSVSGTLNGTTITNGLIQGTWSLQGSGSGCTSTNGQFTMTQSGSTTPTGSST